MSREKIIIIGAGIAGLTAGRTLQQQGYSPLLLDKGRSVGGRLATRRFRKGQADHGAQCFTAKNNDFVGLKDQLLETGLIKEWYRGLPAPHEAANVGIYPRYCGVTSMNSVAKQLAKDLRVETATEVARISPSGTGWIVETNKNRYNADTLILTAPVPQSLNLLETGGVELEAHLQVELQGLTYHPCLTLMVRFESETNLPSPGSLYLSHGTVEWINDNQQKGISDAPVVTIHCHRRYSSENYDQDDDRLVREILAVVKEWLPEKPLETQLQRWRYAKPMSVASRPSYVSDELALALAGDAFVDGRVEGAYLSGRAAAFAIAGLLETRLSRVSAEAQAS